MKRLFQDHSRDLCLALAGVIALVLSVHQILIPIVPLGDGRGYTIRAFALYGYLHTGQWGDFWKLLASPGESILPLHYVFFLLLPKALAGLSAYIIVQNVTTYLLLAYAIFKAAQALDRPEWAPAIFLFCGWNNVAWIDFYSFLLDMQFFAVGLWVIAMQMKAWQELRIRTSLLCGVGLGLLVLLKPANAVIFLSTFALSESGFAVFARREARSKLIRHYGCEALGFIPIACFAGALGAGQTILQLIDQNEVRDFRVPLDGGGLLRLLYFPLCLSAFYHVVLLAGLLLVPILLGRWFPVLRNEAAARLFPLRLFLPVALSYLILGEFFSFWMVAKPMRAMLLTLPLFWLAFCWLWEKQRLRLEGLFLVAVIYALVVFSQKEWDTLGSRDQLLDENYPLTTASWTVMPSPWHWHRGWNLSQGITDSIGRDLPPGGIICINSLEMRNILAWRLECDAPLSGEPLAYEVRNLFDFRGAYYEQSLVGANVVVLITFPPIQSNRVGWLKSIGMLDYANETWCGTNPIARVNPLLSIQGEPVGYEFIFEHPLTQAEVDAINQSAALAGTDTAKPPIGTDAIFGRHYSRADAWRLLQAWFDRRF